ncbi:hypothetical protein CPJCM30710_24960 [Clostridium polyendosporum]|uniref:Siphovirus-type tail component RIFT-related domain-containing protein n=1 Tax=Clostridium polyendosporum TaxID=69208 RepID=A0A919S248_9CLOT|nr:distal tail protein Dit [Clostridium polyendosporum]GIM29830.1 hypothetical protein CPJCM30710_24960 [Clostridium polyendosporum]
MISFQFGGKDSYNDFGIIITQRPSIPSPKRRITSIDVPGRNSSLNFDENTYEDITIAVECTILDDIVDKVDDIKGWLIGTGESNLIFTYQPNKKYIGQVVNSFDIKQAYSSLNEFVIIFNCRPFKYAVSNSVITISTIPGTITNPGTIYSEPIIKVYGSGEGSLTINGVQIQFTGLLNHIILDSTIMDAYNDSGANLNSKMSGKFPTLIPGVNSISYTGCVTKIDVTPFWRWL